MNRRVIFIFGLIFLFATQYYLFALVTKISGFFAFYDAWQTTKTNALNAIFGWIPFSVGDLFYALLFLIVARWLYFSVRYVVLKQYLAILPIIIQFLLLTNILYFIFNSFWGLNYQKQFMLNEQNTTDSIGVEELKFYAKKYLSKSIKARSYFNQEDVFRLSDQDINQISQDYSVSNTSIKPSLYSFFLNYTGVLGYYNPFTGEAQYNHLIPATKLPFTIGHELAHQQGYAPESDASLVGFVGGANASNRQINYSANYTALRYLLSSIYPVDSVFVNHQLNNYSKGMRLDRAYEQQYRAKYNVLTKTMFRRMNDTYLKANHQQKGVLSYADFVILLVNYERANKDNP